MNTSPIDGFYGKLNNFIENKNKNDPDFIKNRKYIEKLTITIRDKPSELRKIDNLMTQLINDRGIETEQRKAFLKDYHLIVVKGYEENVKNSSIMRWFKSLKWKAAEAKALRLGQALEQPQDITQNIKQRNIQSLLGKIYQSIFNSLNVLPKNTGNVAQGDGKSLSVRKSKQLEIDKVQQVETAKNSFINAVNQMTGRNMLSNSEGLTECVEKYRKIRTKRSDLSDKLDEAFEKLITQISPEQSFNTEEDENQFFAKMDQDLFPLKVRLLFDRIK